MTGAQSSILTDAATGRLTVAELAQLERDGFVVREDLFSATEVAAICASCEEIGRASCRERVYSSV